jgi:hypothetical protein
MLSLHLDRARLAVPKNPELWTESVRVERRANNIAQAKVEASSHSATDLGQARVPVPYASRACGSLFCAS